MILLLQCTFKSPPLPKPHGNIVVYLPHWNAISLSNLFCVISAHPWFVDVKQVLEPGRMGAVDGVVSGVTISSLVHHLNSFLDNNGQQN